MVFAMQELAKVANERRCHEAAAAAKALAAQALAAALAKERRRQEVAAHAAQASAAALAKERRCQEVAVRAAQASAEALAKERCCQEVATRAAQALTEASEAAAHAAALAAQASTNKRPPQMVCQRVRPRRCTGRRNSLRAPSPINEALPSRPPPTWGGPSPLILAVPSLVAQESATAGTPLCLEELAGAYSPPWSKTPSPLLFMMASLSPSLQLYNVTRVVSMLLDGGGAHPFRDRGLPLPPRKRARGRHHPRCVCQQHGPWAPNLLEPLLCGWCHWPRAPNRCGGWA